MPGLTGCLEAYMISLEFFNSAFYETLIHSVCYNFKHQNFENYDKN